MGINNFTSCFIFCPFTESLRYFLSFSRAEQSSFFQLISLILPSSSHLTFTFIFSICGLLLSTFSIGLSFSAVHFHLKSCLDCPYHLTLLACLLCSQKMQKYLATHLQASLSFVFLAHFDVFG